MSFRKWDDWPPPSKPREVEGGIKARSQRGAFGTQWWAKRWIAVLESFRIGSRLQRGRNYARRGQVIGIEIAPGIVRASVQGSRPKPYRVTIRVAALSKAAWRKVAQHIASEARFAAKLVAGEMPQDIESVFTAVGLSLFPDRLSDVKTECSCPDSANPCKHVAATYYLIGEEFDRDPFLLFTLRGASKADVLSELHEVESEPGTRSERTNPTPLPMDLSAFWEGAVPAVAMTATTTKPRKRSLPAFPFWRGSQPLEAFLARVDEAAVASALDLLADAEDEQ